MKILIFGGNGFVGGNIAHSAKLAGWDVFIADRETNNTTKDIEEEVIDIANFEEVDELIKKIKPEVVVNTAAIADIDFAESEKEITARTNITGAVNIAKACAAGKIKYIFFSSDAVFDGREDCYREDDIPKPVNYYGLTKAEAEKGIIRELSDYVILRISLVLGFPLERGNSFLASLMQKLKDKKIITVPIDIIRTPIDISTLTKVVLELSLNKFSGILHIACTEKVNRYDLACILGRKMGYPTDRILPGSSENGTSGKAIRHKNGILNISKAERILKTRMPDLNETVESALKTLL